VLRTLPEMAMSASDDERMLLRQRVKTVAHVVEFLNFVQNCGWRHCVPDSSESKEGKLQMG